MTLLRKIFLLNKVIANIQIYSNIQILITALLSCIVAGQLFVYCIDLLYCGTLQCIKLSVNYILPDATGLRQRKRLFLNLGLNAPVKDVAITDCYTIDKTFYPSKRQGIPALANPLLEQANEKPLAPKTFDWAVGDWFLPERHRQRGQHRPRKLWKTE